MNPRVEVFLRQLEARYSRLAPQVLAVARDAPADFDVLAGLMLGWAEGVLGPDYLDVLLDGYCEFCVEVARAQATYEAVGHYPGKSYEETSAKTYLNDEFMRLYHWGVFVTTFAWRHHVSLHRFFRDEFLPYVAGDTPRTLLDLGAGSGVWHQLACHHAPALQVTAVDISPLSVAWSRQTATAAGTADRVTTLVGDALTHRLDTPADVGISCFLMEHLEDPQALLNNLAANLAPGGHAFVTCALTAAEVDHIYELTHESEPVLMAERAGFRTLALRSAAAPNARPRGRHLPRSLAMVLEKPRARR